jgi:hypothetical protein
VAVVVKFIIRGHFFKREFPGSVHSLVYKEHVLSLIRIGVRGGADIQVHPAIVVDIHDRYTTIPTSLYIDVGSICHIFKLKFTFIQVERIRYLVTGKKNVLKTIVIKIGDPYSSPL